MFIVSVIVSNVSTANALQLEAARRRTVLIRFYTSQLPSLKSLSLSVFAAYTLRYAVTLNFDPVTLKVRGRSGGTWS